MVMIATVASPSRACLPRLSAAIYNPHNYHLQLINTVMDLTVVRAPLPRWRGRRVVAQRSIVCAMPKGRVGGDIRPAALKNEGWRYVVALAATVAAIGSNQEQPKGN
jgi:hypothetical protein